MKNLAEYILENLDKFTQELKKLGLEKQQEGKEVWYEGTYKNKLIRVVQEEVGKDDWWLVKVESDYLKTDNDEDMTFETPVEAANEAIEQIDNKLV